MTTTASPRADLEKREDLITLTIDDVEVSVPKGTLVIRAAELIGIDVPRFCDHPLLDPVGACRQCLVEIPDAGNGRPIPKPQASCTLEAAAGMQVKTQLTSTVADKAQRGNMEFLLINHPLDCPICDKGGECPLQNQSMSHGDGETRFTDVKRTYPKPINISANVLLDRERCVLCARCTRFSEQVAGDPFIALIERGALQQVGIYEKEPFQSYFSGNTIQICPVGALTSAAYRFRSRPFDLVSVPAVAEHDACGSAIRVDVRRGQVMRRLAGDDPEVNEEWITDKDRFAFVSGRGDDRLTRPLVRESDPETGEQVLRPASWPEALDAAVRGLQRAGSSVGVLTGGRLTVEDSYGYAKFARAVLGTNNIDFRSRPHSAEEAEFLSTTVAGRGLSLDGSGVSFADLERASSVLLVSLEPEEEAGVLFLRLRKGFRKHELSVHTVAPYRTTGAAKMGATLIPTAPGGEAARLDALDPTTVGLDGDSVIMVGERAAMSSGTLSACVRLAERTGARLVWVPRRAGDRGAVEAGCLPDLLPGGRSVSDPAARIDVAATWGVGSLPSLPGRDGDEILLSASDDELGALIVAGVDVDDLLDPAAALEGLEAIDFVISLETRISPVTERADVVFPVSLLTEREGSFLNWEGRERRFGKVIESGQTVMSDLRVLAALADGLGSSLGIRTPREAAAELAELGVWTGNRPAAPDLAAATALEPENQAGSGRTVVLATWRLALDDSRSMAGEPYLMQTARPALAMMSPATARSAGITDRVLIGNDRGAMTFEARVVSDMVDGVVWVPTKAPRRSIAEQLAAGAGDWVTIAPAPEPTQATTGATTGQEPTA